MNENQTLKQNTINEIIRVEGGYINDSEDSGGETNFGITVAVARKHGYMGMMSKMPRSIAFEIYSIKYWDINHLDEVAKISELIAEEIADCGVNQGVRVVGRFLQRSLNVLNNREELYEDITVDGRPGKNTIKALRLYIAIRKEDGILVLHRMLNALQGARYVKLAERRKKDEKYIYGWFKNRVR